jgi:hypothetical protein
LIEREQVMHKYLDKLAAFAGIWALKRLFNAGSCATYDDNCSSCQATDEMMEIMQEILDEK